MRSLLEASKLTQGTVLVRSPIQVFVDENTDTIAAQLEIGYSKKTENWTAEKIQQHSLVVNHVELHRAEDFVLGDDNNSKFQLLRHVETKCSHALEHITDFYLRFMGHSLDRPWYNPAARSRNTAEDHQHSPQGSRGA